MFLVADLKIEIPRVWRFLQPDRQLDEHVIYLLSYIFEAIPTYDCCDMETNERFFGKMLGKELYIKAEQSVYSSQTEEMLFLYTGNRWTKFYSCIYTQLLRIISTLNSIYLYDICRYFYNENEHTSLNGLIEPYMFK